MSSLKGESRREYEKEWRSRNKDRQTAYARAYYASQKDNPEYQAMKHEASQAARRKKKYGITREEYRDLLTQQNGECIICHSCLNEELRVDHDHITGEVRGLLCSNCNAGLGFFKEDPQRLENAKRYLEKYQKVEGNQADGMGL